MALSPRLALLRRWAVEWLAAGDPGVAAQILVPDYEIAVGGGVIAGRDAYVEATLGQLERFPGLGLTVHELVDSGTDVALRFTEHGASTRDDGRIAAWTGVAIFRFQGDRLSRCWAEEDYLARRRQLRTGEPDAVAPPAPSPWTTEPADPDPDAEAVVRTWLAEGILHTTVTLDDAPDLLDDPRTELDSVICAGPRVAFHGVQRGTYRGGLEGVDDAALGRDAAHALAGIVTVTDGAVSGGHVVRDRLGLQRSLR